MTDGIPVSETANSRFHDILPATEVGLAVIWLYCPGNVANAGAASAVDAQSTWTYRSMAGFAAAKFK